MGTSASKHHLNNTDHGATLSQSSSCSTYNGNDAVTREKNLWDPGNQDSSVSDTFKGGAFINQAMKEGCLSASETKSGSHSAVRNGLDCKVHDRIEKNIRKQSVFGSAPANPLHKETDEASVSVWGNTQKSIKVRPFDNALNGVETGTSPFRCVDSLDATSGLRLLLSPDTKPFRSLPASSRFANVTKNLPSSGRFNHNPDDDIDFKRDLSLLAVCERASDTEGMGDSEEPGSPLFDPSILATFERAIEASSDDNWQTIEVTPSSSSVIAYSSSNVCSDADSPNWSEEFAIVSNTCSSNDTVNEVGVSPVGDIKSSIRTPSAKYAHNHREYLEDFELKCPADCEDKVVLYFTSLRGVRKTYENCCLVRTILKGFRVPIDARDIWMHSKFKEELNNLMGTAVSIPRLFIRGRHIGGAEDVKRLHEEGILEYLLEGLRAECNGMCEHCGGVRFVPCNTCGGSRKMMSSAREIFRCSDCNENGLMLCPTCGSKAMGIVDIPIKT